MPDKEFGICVCGLNGSGKTTLAKLLSQKINFSHFDVEDYYFDNASGVPYALSRTREQVESLLMEDIRKYPKFIFSAVNGNFNEEITLTYKLVIYLSAPLDERMNRIKQRAYDKFGDRVLKGGDMYEQEQKFFDHCAKRSDESIAKWLETLSCPVLRLDGTNTVENNINIILSEIKNMGQN
ncbi:MAG: AAA family ATPase [Clostridia bacterium]|nr:AAA family ATPase [Clostridia bacterium]